jgi:integrase
MLTNAAVKAARPKARAYKLFDERGLFLFIAPTGLRAWRMKFRMGGKEQLLSLGHWPMLSLDEAREAAEEARALITRGIHPGVNNRMIGGEPHVERTVEAVARAWHADRRERWTPIHAGDVLASLERDVFPAIGARPIGAIDAAELLEVIRAIEARGAHETARRVRQRLSMMFEFAIVRQLAAANPAALIAGELKAAPAQQRHPALLDIEALRALLAAAEAIDAPARVKIASRFLALTAVRLSSLRLARWDEFEQLDGPAPLWRIPAAHMKLKKAKKADRANDHIVPLSAAAVQLLQALRALPDAADDFAFPIPGGAIGALYDKAGYGGRHVPHGWRASFSTILNERFPLDSVAIDRALAHAPRGKVEAAYNRAAHLARRRALFDAWAEMLIT